MDSGNWKTHLGSNSMWTHVTMVYRPPGEEAKVFECVEFKWRPEAEQGGCQLVDLKVCCWRLCVAKVAIMFRSKKYKPTSWMAFSQFGNLRTRT